jgi:hypothetical protein
MAKITEKLVFMNSSDAADCKDAIFFEPVPGGYNIVKENTNNEDSDVNLETLFDFVFTNPEKIHTLL